MQQKKHTATKKGVPPRLSDDDFLEILESKAGNISESCKAANRSRSWFYRRFKKSSKFRQAVEEIQESLIDRAESALIQKIDGGDLGAVCFMLKCKGKSRGWVESPRVQGRQKPDTKAVEILEQFSSGDVGAIEACIEFEKAGLPVPETLQILLKKEEPVEPEDDGESLTEEQFAELDRRYDENLAASKMEREVFVPKRKAEVAEIKRELSDQDSFSDENLDGKGD